ncbi:stage III sporulation protein AD [Thalassobacillus sp. CUG 92003]|uniref:stage III sporulation protein AD n=1 Tax=Thalassobacillus sp. CUG 92003 TaxID=2736641 RepID=UPI0015E786FC|nr:stage III sporulation protein AD [Thalassobacillus sp. CUG 92003]
MDILQIVSLAIIAALLILLLKEKKSTLAYLLLLFTGVILFTVLITQITHVFSLITYMSNQANIDRMYVEVILKIIGIAYIAEFGAHIVRDAGLEAIASKVEMAGKIFILLLAMPILTTVIESILKFLPD